MSAEHQDLAGAHLAGGDTCRYSTTVDRLPAFTARRFLFGGRRPTRQGVLFGGPYTMAGALDARLPDPPGQRVLAVSGQRLLLLAGPPAEPDLLWDCPLDALLRTSVEGHLLGLSFRDGSRVTVITAGAAGFAAAVRP